MRNGARVRPNPDFHRDMERLIAELTRISRQDDDRKVRPAHRQAVGPAIVPPPIHDPPTTTDGLPNASMGAPLVRWDWRSNERILLRTQGRWAGIYLVVSWLIVQVVDILLQFVEAPGWIMRALVQAALIGLPLVLLVSFLTLDVRMWSRDVRRSLVQVSTAYIIVSWLALQVASIVFPTLYVPDSVTNTVLPLIGVGFPIAVIIGWAVAIARPAEISPWYAGGSLGIPSVLLVVGVYILQPWNIFENSADPGSSQHINLPTDSPSSLDASVVEDSTADTGNREPEDDNGIASEPEEIFRIPHNEQVLSGSFVSSTTFEPIADKIELIFSGSAFSRSKDMADEIGYDVQIQDLGNNIICCGSISFVNAGYGKRVQIFAVIFQELESTQPHRISVRVLQTSERAGETDQLIIQQRAVD